MCSVCGQQLSVSRCIICGRLVCRNCSVELQPGIRVCINCYGDLDKIVRRYPSLTYLTRYLSRKA
ncbi:MAG: hypothetical protein J7J11_01625 [Desulfurococcales archaeon]|nr:hypothetical protein [Desulfurococcales archaeon]